MNRKNIAALLLLTVSAHNLVAGGTPVAYSEAPRSTTKSAERRKQENQRRAEQKQLTMQEKKRREEKKKKTKQIQAIKQ